MISSTLGEIAKQQAYAETNRAGLGQIVNTRARGPSLPDLHNGSMEIEDMATEARRMASRLRDSLIGTELESGAEKNPHPPIPTETPIQAMAVIQGDTRRKLRDIMDILNSIEQTLFGTGG